VLPIIEARDTAHALELAHLTGFGLYSTSMPTTWTRRTLCAWHQDHYGTHQHHVYRQSEQPLFRMESNAAPSLINGCKILEAFTSWYWLTLQKQDQNPLPLYVATQVHNTSCAVTQAMPH